MASIYIMVETSWHSFSTIMYKDVSMRGLCVENHSKMSNFLVENITGSLILNNTKYNGQSDTK